MKHKQISVNIHCNEKIGTYSMQYSQLNTSSFVSARHLHFKIFQKLVYAIYFFFDIVSHMILIVFIFNFESHE